MLYILKDLTIDTDARSVCRGDVVIKVPDLSFDVLIALIEAAPAPMNNADLCRKVWQVKYVNDETIAQRLTLIRKALGDNTKDPKYIRTVRGSGYAIVGSVIQKEYKAPPKTIKLYSIKPTLAITLGLSALLFISVFHIGNSGFKFKTEPGNDPKQEDIQQKTTGAIQIKRAQEQLRLHQATETDRAIAMLRDVLRHDPKNFDARLTLSFALSTKATKFGGDIDQKKEAELIALALINEQPNNSDARSALGYTLSSQGRPTEALSAYQYAYQLDPENAPALSSAAYILLLRGDLQQALLLEAQAKKSGGTSRYSEIQIAQILELIGHSSASTWRTRALAFNPEQVVVLGEIARHHLRQGNPNAALDILKQTKGADQYAPNILQLQGRAAIALGKSEEAQTVLEKAGWIGQYELAALHAAMGDRSLATELLPPSKQTDIESDPDPALRVQLAEIASALNQEEKALMLLIQAVNLGWRDIKWLKQSPYLKTLMASKNGRSLEDRIKREIEAQRQLIQNTKELAFIIDS